MGQISDEANDVYRDFVTDGVPASGPNDPSKPDIRSLFSAVDVAIAASASGITIVATTAARDTFYGDPANQSKLVYVNNNNGSATDPANGVYEYVSGAARIAQGFYQGLSTVVQPLVDEAQASAEDAAASATILGGVFTFESNYSFPGLLTEDGRILLYADPVSGEIDFLPSAQLQARFTGGSSSGGGSQKTDFSRLYMWGDSRTQGAGDTAPNTFPDFAIAALPQVAVHGKNADNLGRSGQLSAEIVARQGGVPAILTVTGNSIPASGSIAVTSRSVDIFKYGGSVNGSATFNSQTGTLAGVHGTYANDGAGNHTFTRNDAGSATPVPIGSEFIPDIAVSAAPAVNFLCAGTNDPVGTSIDAILFNTLAARQYTEANGGLMMVASVIGRLRGSPDDTDQSDIILLNQKLKAAHGRYYLDFLTPPTTAEMTAVGYTPTSTDTADIAAGYWPTGLYDGTDNVHFQRLGQKIQVNRMVVMFDNLKMGAA